jgi:hypothetical protein
MGEDRTYSRTVVILALLAGALLGVLGANVFRAPYPNLPSATAYTAPQPLSVVGDLLAVEAYVDSNGRIQDYRVLSATQNLRSHAKNALLFTTFRPATFMGRRTSGTATIIFSDASGTVASSSQTQ